MHRIRSTLALLLLTGALHPVLAARVRVTADHVNLRAAALETSEVVGQVATGDELMALSDIGDAWVQVAPPASVDLWVFAELVHGGSVIVSKAQVRAGAGLNFNVVGSLRRGTPVTERGRLGDWLKIAPPDGTSLWISREFIEPLAVQEAPTAVVAPVPLPAPVPSSPAPPPLPDSNAPPPADTRYPEIPPEAASAPASPVAPAATTVPENPPPTVAPAPAAEPVPAPVPAQEPALPTSAAPTRATQPSEGPQVVVEAVTPAPAVTPFIPPPAPRRDDTADWERPAPGAVPRPQNPVVATPAMRPRPRVLFPQHPDASRAVGSAGIPADRLVPGLEQGQPGRLEGQLSGAGAIFYTPGKYRLVVINRAGRAVTVGYVLGSETQLGALAGKRLTIEGPVYWFKSTQYPTIVAERIQRHP